MKLVHIGVDASSLTGKRTGVGNYVYPILLELVERNPDIHFSLFSNTDIEFPIRGNVSFHVSKPKNRGPFWQISDLRRMLAQTRPQLLWGTNGLLPFPLVQGMAQVLTVHDMVYRFAPQTLPWYSYPGRRLLQPWSAKSAQRVVAVSHATAMDIKEFYGVSVAQVVQPIADSVYAKPPSPAVQEVLARRHLPPKYYLSVGTIEPRKNLLHLILAHKATYAKYPSLPPLVLVGRLGWKHGPVLQAIQDGEKAGRLIWLRNVDNTELPSLYAACHALLMPSLYEGFGIPLLEAQLCGAPVVHGTHPSMAEAAGGLGVATGISVEALTQTFEQLHNGSLPLICRLPNTFEQTAQQSAILMLNQFHLAWQEFCS